ncbi:MAG: GTP-binding protein YchF [Parcubacteria group bacterium GW2011_GWA1_42_7]|nr:MAG: GTP-binding protein YchF [Parcubacteria group bacterium GW2011_GWA1_42_7]
MLSIAIVGMPNVGKSTLFKALTKKQVDIQNFPFCTIEPNVGIVEVPDERLQKLAQTSKSLKIIPAAIQFIDIAGLVAGASKGEGLGNQFLSHIRESDAIAQVVRAFEDENIIHVDGKPNPEKDAEISHLPKVEKKAKSGDKTGIIEFELTKNLITFLEKGQSAKDFEACENEIPIIKSLNLLTSKPVLYIINCSSDKKILNYPDKLKPALEIDVKLENELSELSLAEAEEMRKELPHPKNNLDDLVSICYDLLGLETFFTSGEKETRAWTIEKGSKAPQAAGKIHSDFEKGFIRADIIRWDKLVEAGSWNQAKQNGLVRTEGKDYIFQDGDTAIFKFN